MRSTVTARPDEAHSAKTWRQAALALGLVVFFLSALAVAFGCGGSGSTTPSATSASSPQASLSQSDSATLAFVVDTAKRLDADAAATADFLAALENGTWLKQSEAEQLATLSNLESLSQSLTRTITEGFPKAQAADLQAAVKGALAAAAKACSDYMSEAANAASNLLYLPAARVKADTPGWVKRMIQKADRYTPARKRLEQAMADLRAKYRG